jgi:iron complex outermembrane recepter protein
MTPGNILTGAPLPGALSQVLAPGGCGSLGTFTTTPGVGSYCTQNMELYQDDQPRTTREGLYARATVDPNAHTEVYLDLSYFVFQDSFTGFRCRRGPRKSRPARRRIPIPSFCRRGLPARADRGRALNPNDPFPNSPTCVEGVSCTDALINYAFGDIPAYSNVSNNNFRATLAVKGDFWGWTYNGAVTEAHSWVLLDIHGAINFPQLITDVNDGAYNFLDPSLNTAAVREALSPVMSSDSTSNMDSFDASATREVFDLPGGPAQFSLGAQYRTESLNSPSFNANQEGQDYQNSFATGSRTIASVFGELDLPILKTLEATYRPASTIIRISATPPTRKAASSGRRSRKSHSGARPRAASRLRALRKTATPNPPDTSQRRVRAIPPAWAATHGDDAYADNTYSLEEISTSFAGIKPETSENFTGGVVLKPFADQNFTASVNYYYIQKWNAIQFPDTAIAIQDYLAGMPLPAGYSIVPDAVDPLFPTAIPRPVIVAAPYSNNGSIITDGLDVSISAAFQLTDDLNYSTQFNGTHIFEFSSIIPGNPRLEYVGTESPCEYTSCEGTPQDRFTWSHTFDYDKWSVTGTLLYVSGEKNIESDFVGPGGTVYPFANGGAFWDFNLHASYQITDQVQIFGNVLNVFNTPPPVEPAQYGGVNYNPAAYQAGIVGRFFSLGVHIKTN